MPRFFIDTSDVRSGPFPGDELSSGAEKRIVIRGGDAAHISRVLRMRPGESLVACDSAGTEYETVLLAVGEECVLSVQSERPSRSEPPYRAVICQALVKGDKFETVIQKGTELGALVFIPVMTRRCVARLEGKDAGKKVERWQKIAEEAAKQCGRGRIPEVRMPVSLKEALAGQSPLKLFCYEGEGTIPLSAILDSGKDGGTSTSVPEEIAVFIGPEGGFEPGEVDLAVENGAKLTGLGRRILRTETASAYVLSCLSFQYEI